MIIYMRQPRGQTAVIYTRLSLDKYGDGLAVERQSKDAKALAQRNGWKVVAEYSDNSVSATSGVKRPGWEQTLTALTDGTADALIGYSPDRFVRRAKDLERLLDLVEARNVKVSTVMAGDYNLNTPGGRGVARMMVTFAQMETETKAERQQAQERQRAEQGKARKVGARPFGYLKDGVTPHPVEGPALAQAIRNVTAGGSILAVGREWAAASIFPVRGGVWRASSLNALLSRPRNAGLSVHRKEVVGIGEWTPLVSVDEHEALLAVLANPARRTSRIGRRWLLPGIATCGTCGSRAMVGGLNIRGAKRSVYRCSEAGHMYRTAPNIDAMVEDAMRKRLARKDAVQLTRTRVNVGPLVAQVSALRGRLSKAEQDYSEGIITGQQLNVATARIMTQIAEVQTRIAEVSDDVALPDGDSWDDLTLDRKRMLIRSLLTVTVHGTKDQPEDCGPYGLRMEWKR